MWPLPLGDLCTARCERGAGDRLARIQPDSLDRRRTDGSPGDSWSEGGAAGSPVVGNKGRSPCTSYETAANHAGRVRPIAGHLERTCSGYDMSAVERKLP